MFVYISTIYLSSSSSPCFSIALHLFLAFPRCNLGRYELVTPYCIYFTLYVDYQNSESKLKLSHFKVQSSVFKSSLYLLNLNFTEFMDVLNVHLPCQPISLKNFHSFNFCSKSRNCSTQFSNSSLCIFNKVNLLLKKIRVILMLPYQIQI